MPPAESARNTRDFNGNKLICFKLVLTSDEYCFSYAHVHDSNLLPNNITVLTSLNSALNRIFLSTAVFNFGQSYCFYIQFYIN